MGISRRWSLAVLAGFTVALTVALASSAVADPPVRGASYTGTVGESGSISFSVADDGRRIVDLRGVVPSDDGGGDITFDAREDVAIARDGAFDDDIVPVESNVGFGAQVSLRGRFESDGMVSGEVQYVDRLNFTGGGRFAARAGGGPRDGRLVFDLADSVGFLAPRGGVPATDARLDVAGIDELGDGSVIVAGGGSVRRIYRNGRVATAFAAGEQVVFADDVGRLPAGGYLIADGGAHCIRRVEPGGALGVVAGRCGVEGYSGDGGPATQATLSDPDAVAAAADGGFFVLERGEDGSRVRRVAPDGTISTAAGTGAPGSSGDGGPATDAAIGDVPDIAAQADGGLLLVDIDSDRVRRVAPDGTIATVAGTGEAGAGGDNGPATEARLDNPFAVVARPDGGFLLVDRGNHRIRAVSAAGTITTFAGGAGSGLGAEGGGPATPAELRFPGSLHLLGNGGVAFDDFAGLRLVTGSPVRRLLVGFRARASTLYQAVRRRGVLPVVTTKRARVTVALRRNGRAVRRVRRILGPGRTLIRLPRAAPARERYRLRIHATRGGRAVATTGVLIDRPAQTSTRSGDRPRSGS